MQIGKFKLDHLVEKNNECIIYRGSDQEDKFIIIQLNRQPLLKVELFNKHFQEELKMLFKYCQKPKIIPTDFPFQIPESETLDSELIEFPSIIEIHQTETHYYFILANCLQGQILNQDVDHPKTFLQIYTLYDYYYQEYLEGKIKDRDFALMRIFRSQDKLTLIDFGFACLQKQLPKKPWQVKLGELFNSLTQFKAKLKGKNLINTLLAGKIKWEEIRDFISISFGLNEIDQSLQENQSDRNSKITRQNSIHTKQQTQTLSMFPQEIITLNQNSSRKASPYNHSQKQQSRNSTMMQTRIISYGNQQKEHFQKIRQSLSPGFSATNRYPCRLFQIEQNTQQPSPQARSVSRKAQHLSNNQKQPITKPLENQFEYRNRSTPREEIQYEQNQIQQLIGDQYLPIQEQQKQIQRKLISITTNQSQYEASSYAPTLIQRGQSLNEKQDGQFQQNNHELRPKSSRTQDQKQELKTLLRTSTRELQQPGQINKKSTQEYPANRTINYSDTQSLFDNLEIKQVRKPQSRRNSIRKSSTNSIENIELSNGSTANQQRLIINNNLQNNRQMFKTPRDQRQMQYSFQNSPIENPHIKKQNPIMAQQYQDEVQNFQQKSKKNSAEEDNDEVCSYQPSFEQHQNKSKNQENVVLIKNNKQKDIEIEKYIDNVEQIQQNKQYQFQMSEKNEIPSFCQEKQKTNNQEIISQQQRTQNEAQIIKSPNQDQRITVESVDEYYKQPKIKKQNSFKLPPTPKTDKATKEQFKIELQQNNYLQDNQQKQKSIQQNENVQKLQKIEDSPKSIKRINLNDIEVAQLNIQEIKVKLDENEARRIAQIYENQLKKYDIIGKMVGGNVKYFQALKNFWIVPLFLCFKRMVSFRKLYEEGLKEKVNFFDLDMEKVNQVDKIKNLETKLTNDNKIVASELESLYLQCQKTAQKFEPKELAKIQKFLNMDLQQDIKDIYFVYLYTQIFRTLQNLRIKCESDNQKTKENLVLQASCLASLIISEMPFSSDKKFFDLDEFEKVTESQQYNQQLLEQYIKTKDEVIGHLKKRLITKGIKI
ncbi:unnamed protein product (macronuclear) [Paramecium tetraurelia]|uniref:Uncharacterized protein n=1 Tax=Paramecium tetraurelia TaxID=5888 RepID=A0E925_PARTE|nr:uncharacterized protein GSPATT00024523001 [Paramecium tetraurelia]CAK91792.1 unnamed protein product [Paramecium tetraurelia]|eukprot:XP_001459189.1 hypothetical protein (macronuclear) [Paramecium tetraurelia strain d4-2]